MAWTGKEECVNECKTGDCRKNFDGIAGKVMDTLISEYPEGISLADVREIFSTIENRFFELKVVFLDS